VAYASGKFAFGLCDYCGQRYPLNVLKKNWRGFKVCPDDYEPKEPQLDPLRFVADAVALEQPRPDRVEPVDVFVGAPADSAFQSIGSALDKVDMRPYPETVDITGAGLIGTVRIETT
jgi:hypothetical protein